MRHFIIAILLIFFQFTLDAQVVISGAWEQDTVVIGDEVDFILSLEIKEGTEIAAVDGRFIDSIYSVLASVKAQTDTSQPLIPKIADFELLNIGNWKEIEDDQIFSSDELQWQRSQAGSTILLQNTFRFRLWDPGETIILYPAVAWTNGAMQDQTISEVRSAIFVAPPGGTALLDSLGLADIKPIIEEPAQLSDYLIYFIILGVALLLGLIYWWWTKFGSKRAEESVIVETLIKIEPAHEIAMRELENLHGRQLWQQGKIKQYQSELTHIIRAYLENRYGIQALESTTDEIINQHVKDLLQNDDKQSLQRILQVADLVKFAKAQPEVSIHETFMKEAVEFVDRTKKIESPEVDE